MRSIDSFKYAILAASVLVGCGGPQVDIAAETEAVRARSEGIVAAEAASR